MTRADREAALAGERHRQRVDVRQPAGRRRTFGVGDGDGHVADLERLIDATAEQQRAVIEDARHHPHRRITDRVGEFDRLGAAAEPLLPTARCHAGIPDAHQHPPENFLVVELAGHGFGLVTQHQATLVVTAESDLGRELRQEPRPIGRRAVADCVEREFGELDPLGVDLTDDAGDAAAVGQHGAHQQRGLARARARGATHQGASRGNRGWPGRVGTPPARTARRSGPARRRRRPRRADR